MKKSMCCNENMIYLGKTNNYHKFILSFSLPIVYLYCCSECGNIEWSSYKEKTKYKWYKYDKQKLKKLIKLQI